MHRFANNPSLCVEGSQNCSTPNQKSSSKTPYWIVGLAAGIGALILILVTLLLCFICPGCCLYKARRRSLSRMHSSRGDVHPIHVGAGSSAGRLIPSVDNEAYTKKLEQDFWNAGEIQRILHISLLYLISGQWQGSFSVTGH